MRLLHNLYSPMPGDLVLVPENFWLRPNIYCRQTARMRMNKKDNMRVIVSAHVDDMGNELFLSIIYAGALCWMNVFERKLKAGEIKIFRA